jgi:hypothetical protein
LTESNKNSIPDNKLPSIFALDRTAILVVTPLIILASLLYFDGLFLNKSVMHGDSIIHGYPVLSYHASVLEGDNSLLWSDKLYGGHPIHAEGQFAFFSPLNTLIAFVFSPAVGQNIFHWLTLILSGAGVFALCRSLGISRSATCFAVIAVPFSSFWIGAQQNLSVAGALAWIPWALWALEKWRNNPDRFLPLTLCMVLLVASGYPQVLHGVAIYMATAILSSFLFKYERDVFKRQWQRFLCTGFVAVLLCCGLAAVQLLPLFELIGYSHRSAGVEMWPIPAETTFRGLLYNPTAVRTELQYFPVIGSILTCVLASASLVYRLPPRICGHLVASLVLLNLGMSNGSPLFTFLYEHNLMPGLQYFRLSWPYYSMAVVGISLLAAFMIDKLGKIDFGNKINWLKGLLLSLFWVYSIHRLHMQETPLLQYAIVIVGLVASAVLIKFKKGGGYIALVLSSLLIVEIVQLKFGVLYFYNNDLITSTPASISQLTKDRDLGDDKFVDLSLAAGYGFVPPRSPKVKRATVRMLNAVSASSNLLWNIPSLQGAHALPLARRMLVEDYIRQEITDEGMGRAGLRLIDFLGVRYITVPDYQLNESIVPLYHDRELGIRIVENTSALPKFQIFTDYAIVDGPQAAFALLQAIDSPLLVIESGNAEAPPAAPTVTGNKEAVTFTVQRNDPVDYRVTIEAPRAGWFFIADANYPGWEAFLDGREVPVYSAQLLGKAVWFPEGKHELNVRFEPKTFYWGLWITLLSLASCIIIAIYQRNRERQLRG